MEQSPPKPDPTNNNGINSQDAGDERLYCITSQQICSNETGEKQRAKYKPATVQLLRQHHSLTFRFILSGLGGLGVVTSTPITCYVDVYFSKLRLSITARLKLIST